MKFEIDLPPEIRFGRKCRFDLDSILPHGKILFICGQHSVDRIKNEMIPHLGKREISVCAAFAGEPHLDEIDKLLEFAKKEKFSAIIGWGGGSAMDGAKAVAALYGEKLPVAEFFYNRAAASRRQVFFAAVPTTAGTGSEVTANAVLTDAETGIKQSLRAPGMTADAAIVDPELVEECPSSVMAASGFDALTQAIESFISARADALTSALSRVAARDIFLNLKKACAHDRAAVDAVTAGSLNCGMAFSKSGLGAVHGICHPLGSLLSVRHGVCCAILLTEVLKFNLPAVENKMNELALFCGAANGADLIEKIAVLRRELAIPENFKSFGLAENHFDFIVKNCRSGSMKCNPRRMSDSEVVALLERLK